MPQQKMTYDQFMEMKRQKELGVSQRKIVQNTGITRGMMERWYNRDEEEFINGRGAKCAQLEQYREFLVSILKVYPQIRATNAYFRLTETFPKASFKRATFFRFFSKVREESGYGKFKKRMISPREQLPPGYEAQVDFGQYKLKDMYGITVRVYFFAMVLSYSQMRFAYFSRAPFTTETAIQAHEYAFKYFNGRTQTIMYDLDRVFVANENYGDIVYVPRFEQYVRETGFTTTMCRPRDPRSKGRVENLVGYIKKSFLEGRTYSGIDSLNSACLNWLDTMANDVVNLATRKIPREMFREEVRYLIPVKQRMEQPKQIIASVTSKNSVIYLKNQYALPRGKAEEYDGIRVEEVDDCIYLYMASTNEYLCKHKKAEGEGQVVTLEETYTDKVAIDSVLRTFGNDERLHRFIDGIKPRYRHAQGGQVNHLAKYYTRLQVIGGIEYCLRVGRCNTTELAGYLIYKYGTATSKRCFSKEKLLLYTKRAKQIKEELDG